MNYVFILLAILMALLTPSATNAQSAQFRGLYVDNFKDILGNPAAEKKLLEYAKAQRLNYLAFYDLQHIHAKYDMTHPETAGVLRDFIKKSKTKYDVKEIGAVWESAKYFENIVAVYNNNCTDPNERFDVFNLEFEFWSEHLICSKAYYDEHYLNPNGYTCDNAGAFTFFIKEMEKIHALAQKMGVKSETYVGRITDEQAKLIAKYTDRILVHVYQSDSKKFYPYAKKRLEQFAAADKKVTLIPIFSSEECFAGPWLQKNSMDLAYLLFIADFLKDSGSWRSNISIPGFHWYTYSCMKSTND